MKSKMLALLEVLLVFVLIQTLVQFYRLTGLFEWEQEVLGWSYIAMLPFIGIPALIIWLTGRSWTEYGVSMVRWPTNLDIGLKAFLVTFIPLAIGQYGPSILGLNPAARMIFKVLMGIIAIVLIVWLMNRQKPVLSGRRNLISIGLIVLIPIVVALAVGQLSLVVVSTMIWQLIFSGFGEEFVYRGYYQSRLNQAFGRPFCLSGVQFGAGLIVASLLFGLMHAFNNYDPAVGFASFNWEWALSSGMAGLFFGVIREKTGTLLAPGLAHGLPDLVGEPMKIMFSWM